MQVCIDIMLISEPISKPFNSTLSDEDVGVGGEDNLEEHTCCTRVVEWVAVNIGVFMDLCGQGCLEGLQSE